MASYTIYHVSKPAENKDLLDLWPYGKPVLVEVDRRSTSWRVQRWVDQHPAADIWVREVDTYQNVRWHHMTPDASETTTPNFEHAPWLVAKWFEILDLTKIVCEGERI